MSKIEVDTIDTVTGTSELTIGGTNATSITLGSGASFSNVSGQNYPAFQAALSTGSSQTIPSQTHTKGIFANEVFDTDNAYDTSNGRFTVPTGKGGKYHVMSTVFIDDIDNEDNVAARIYVNGVGTNNPSLQNQFYGSGSSQNILFNVSNLIDLNEGDYVEVFVYQGTTTDQNLRSTSSFSMYRIGS